MQMGRERSLTGRSVLVVIIKQIFVNKFLLPKYFKVADGYLREENKNGLKKRRGGWGVG